MITAADIGDLLGKREQQLREAKLTIVYAGTSDSDGWGRRVSEKEKPQFYPDFLRAFTGQGFDEAHLVDGQAIQMHDAFLTAAEAVELATSGNSSPTAAKVHRELLNLNSASSVPAAGGTLSFSLQPGGGNPLGKLVPVLEFPSPPVTPTASKWVTPVYVTDS